MIRKTRVFASLLMMAVLLIPFFVLAKRDLRSSEIESALDDGGEVEVIVMLKDTGIPSMPSIAEAETSIERNVMSSQLRSRKESIASMQEKVLKRSGKGIRSEHKYMAISGFRGTVTKQAYEALLADPDVMSIDLNRQVQASLDGSVPYIGSDSFWDTGFGGIYVNGTGETICVIDTGVNYTHPDLGGCLGGGCKVVGGRNFCATEGCSTQNANVFDNHGHGTHVAAIAASFGATYRGVAPGAKIVSAKALNSTGGGNFGSVIAGIDWCVANANAYDISAIVMSLGDGGEYNEACDSAYPSMTTAVNAAASAGILVVAAAGNSGNLAGVSLPACISSVTSVGSVDLADSVFSSSNSGDTLDLLAPGVGIRAAIGSSSHIDRTGTSMAAPHVAGGALLVRNYKRVRNNSILSPSVIKDVLVRTGVNVVDTKNDHATPRLDLDSALDYLEASPQVTAFQGVQNRSLTRSRSAYIKFNSSKPLQNATLMFDSVGYDMQGSTNGLWYNKTGLSDGTHTYAVYFQDTTKNMQATGLYSFDVDTTAPSWSAKKESRPSGSQLAPGSVQFNITWTDNTRMDKVRVEHNFSGTLATYAVTGNRSDEYYYTYAGFSGPGGYVWRMIANDTAGNSASTSSFSYVVTAQPEITVLSPINESMIGSTTTLINLTTDMPTTCKYRLNGSPYQSITSSLVTKHSRSITVPQGESNLTFNCTNQYSLSTESTISILVDSLSPVITVRAPSNGKELPGLDFDLNYSISDVSLTDIWYRINADSTKHSLPGSAPLADDAQTVTVPGTGKNLITVYANDSLGHLSTRQVTVYVNSSLDVAAWKSSIESRGDVDTVTLFNSTGQALTGDAYIKQDITLQINLSEATGVTIRIVGLPGLSSTWSSLFTAHDDDASFESSVNSQLGTDIVHMAYMTGFTDFQNQTGSYHAIVRLPENSTFYDDIYYCPDSVLGNCYTLSACQSAFTDSSSTACYVSAVGHTDVYIPHFSAVFGVVDTTPPNLNIRSPAHGSTLSSGYNTLLNVTVNEAVQGCYYRLDGAVSTAMSQSSSLNYVFTVHPIRNGQHNITVRCMDRSGLNGTAQSIFTVSDSTAPLATVVSVGGAADRKTTDTTPPVIVTTNEPARCRYNISNTTYAKMSVNFTQSNGNLTHTISSLPEHAVGSYTRWIGCIDNNGNSAVASFTFQITRASSKNSGGGGGSPSSTTQGPPPPPSRVTVIWDGVHKGNKTMFVTSTLISVTQLIADIKEDMGSKITMAVSVENGLPEHMSGKSGTVYQYLRVTHAGMTNDDIDGVLFKFKVGNDWIAKHNIDVKTIRMYRYDGAWQELDTRSINLDSRFHYFEANSPGLSYFAIAAESRGEVGPDGTSGGGSTGTDEPQVTGNVPLDVTPGTGGGNSTSSLKNPPPNLADFTLPLLFIVVVGIMVSFIVYQNKYSVVTDSDLRDIRNYVQKCISEGIPYEQIKETLVKVGWKANLIDLILHDVHLPSEDIDKMVAYIEYVQKQGESDTVITENLLKVGWQKEVIDKVFKMIKKTK